MSKGKRLTAYERGKIDGLRSKNMSHAAIAKKIKRSQNVVSNYLRMGQKYGFKGKKGRKPSLSDSTKRQINRIASNKSITAAQIKSQLGLEQHVRTIQRHLASSTILHLEKLKKKTRPNIKTCFSTFRMGQKSDDEQT